MDHITEHQNPMRGRAMRATGRDPKRASSRVAAAPSPNTTRMALASNSLRNRVPVHETNAEFARLRAVDLHREGVRPFPDQPGNIQIVDAPDTLDLVLSDDLVSVEIDLSAVVDAFEHQAGADAWAGRRHGELRAVPPGLLEGRRRKVAQVFREEDIPVDP
jgi:hypothetical protein